MIKKTNLRSAFSVLLTATFLFLFAVSNFAQGSSSVRGTVTDPKGEAVAGATVTLKSTTKNFSKTQTTSADGVYNFPVVPPDTYRIEIEATGFKKTVASVTAQIDTPKDLNLTLELGQVTESVTVSTSTEAPLNTTNGSIGNTITTSQIIQLPLSARNTPDLLSLQPGVTTSGEVNGGRSDQGNITLDGVDVNEQQGGRAFFTVLRVTPEALQEFRVTTTNADANQGRSSGAQISLITKSGSNKIHGSAYLYNRPGKRFQANDFFSNANRVAQNSRSRQNYGGSILGPIKKDKWFFALFYERFVENAEVPVTRTVPLPSLGQGVVKYRSTNTSLVDPNCPAGTAVGIACKTTAQINAAYIAANTATPGINPIATAFLGAAAARYKANDTTAGDGLNTSGFRFNAKAPIRQNVVTTRIDGKVADSQDVFLRFQYQADNSSSVSRFPDTLSANTWVHPWGIAAGHTLTIGSSMVNKFTYGLTRDAFTVGGDSTQNFYSFRFVYQPFSFSRTLSRVTPVQNFVDDFTWVKGNHTISAGGNIRLIKNSRNSFGASYDNASTNPSFYDFSGDVVTNFGGLFPDISGKSTINLRDALTAVIGRYSQYGANLQYGKDGKLQPLGSGVARTFKTQEYEAYLQDSWRMFNNFTVNYGVRFSTSTPVYESNGLQVKPTTSLSDFYDKRVAAALNGQADNTLLKVDLAGKANKKDGYYKQDWNNFAPAISAAWSPNFKNGALKAIFGSNGKSTIRGGFRMTYDRIGSALAVAFDLNSTLGYSSTSSIAANTFDVGANLGPLFTGIGQSIRTLPGITANPTLSFPLQTTADEDARIEQSLDDKIRTPYNYNFNLSYGREFKGGISIEASYVGRIAKKLLVSRDTAHFNNLKDPASGQDFYGVMRTLIGYRNANAAITSIPNIAWFNRFVPGLAGNYNINGVSTTLTATQAAYRRVARSCSNNAPRDPVTNACVGGNTSINGRNTTDYTFVQLLWDDGLGFGNNIFIHPQYATFAAYSTIGESDYNAFQLSARKRFGQGLMFDVNYTYSHSLDTASGTESSGTISSGASLILNPLNLTENRGNSDFDARHLINANFIYDLPIGKGRKFLGNNKIADWIIGGWQLAGIYRWNTGFPIGQPFDDGRWATNWNVQSNGVRLTDIAASPTKNGPGGLPNLFSDPNAAYRNYRNALPGEAGDRNILREPNYISFDAGLSKSFRVTETQKIFIKAEAFNISNTQRLTGIANFRLGQDPFAPGSSGGTAPDDFGKFTNIQGSPRVFQFVLRYEF
jgi:Carboxypeptidase regulatory-like domain